MSVDTVAAALEREHHEIDAGVNAFVVGFARGEPDVRPLVRATTALRRHIYLEEECLFPPLRAAGLIAPVFVMVREHGQMWQTLDALDAELREGAKSEAVAELLRDLRQQLEAHNLKEERVLYPQADQVLTASATTELRELLNAGHIPDGWVCQANRC